jgi:hypothetical protein
MAAGPGRPPGSRNKRDAELFDRLEKRGDRLAVDLLSEIANNENEPKQLRIQAMIGVAPYQTAKLGLIPQPTPLVFVAEPIALPYPKPLEIRHTLANIARLSAAWRRGDLDLATFEAALAEQRIVRDGLIEQQKLLVAQGGPPNQRIEIKGGLPPLPGTEIDMNGTAFAARVAAAHPAVVNGEAVRPDLVSGPPVPFIPHPESPLAQKPGQPKHPVGDKPEGGDPA